MDKQYSLLAGVAVFAVLGIASRESYFDRLAKYHWWFSQRQDILCGKFESLHIPNIS